MVSRFSKDFDHIDHVLVSKLVSLDVRSFLIRWICIFLNGRRQAVSPSGCQSMWVSLRALNWANYVPNYDQRFRITVSISLYNLLYYPVNRLELMTAKQYQRRSPWPVHLSYNPICDIIILVVIVKQRN